MSYRLAKLLPIVDSHYLIAADDDDAKSGAAEYLRSESPGTYVLLSVDPGNGKHEVVTTYEVKTLDQRGRATRPVRTVKEKKHA